MLSCEYGYHTIHTSIGCVWYRIVPYRTIPYIPYDMYHTMLASLPSSACEHGKRGASERNKRDKIVRYLPMNNLNKELVQTLQIASWHLLLFMCDGAPARPRKGSAGATISYSHFFGDSSHHSLSAFTFHRRANKRSHSKTLYL